MRQEIFRRKIAKTDVIVNVDRIACTSSCVLRWTERLTTWCDDVKHIDTDRLTTLFGLGSKITKLLGAKNKIASTGREKTASGET